jgi:Ni/Co efflux regulator RcnB
MPRYFTAVVTVAMLVGSTSTAFAQRYDAQGRQIDQHNQHRQVQTRSRQQQQTQVIRTARFRVGQQVRRQDVVVVTDWQRRGLRRPSVNETYVLSGDDILLVAASTLIIKALMN